MTPDAISTCRLLRVCLVLLAVRFDTASVSAAEPADLVIRQANVLTVDAKHPKASARREVRRSWH